MFNLVLILTTFCLFDLGLERRLTAGVPELLDIVMGQVVEKVLGFEGVRLLVGLNVSHLREVKLNIMDRY